ncbi:MAG: hypothetical protein R2873_02185 [Caldilineaceae bacterium]
MPALNAGPDTSTFPAVSTPWPRTLYATGQVTTLISGGRTGGADRPSEAELMGADQWRFGVPAADLWLETAEARNTVNMVLVANMLIGRSNTSSG